MHGDNANPGTWRKCTTCKKSVAFSAQYWVCSVSTCNRARTDLLFCSVSCFDAHVPVLNHRDAGAFERRAPSEAEWKRQQAEAQNPAPRPRAARTPGEKTEGSKLAGSEPAGEILVVASKVKEYIRQKSGMNTSATVLEVLSEKIRAMADDAIRRATQDERKTVLDRDIK